MRIMIHAVPKRMEHVNTLRFILVAQGVHPEEILLYVDENMEGNLEATVKSYEYLEERILDPEEQIWHLQDDVVICEDFAERIRIIQEDMPHGIVCAFCSEVDRGVRPGNVSPALMWYSFQCIRIPVGLSSAFAMWIRDGDHLEEQAKKIEANKFDDSLFMEYMIEQHPFYPVYNCSPNLVDHRDDMCGGSIVNPGREEQIRALYYTERASDAWVNRL